MCYTPLVSRGAVPLRQIGQRLSMAQALSTHASQNHFLFFFRTVREFGFMYCDLTGAGFRSHIPTNKALTQIACRDEAPSAQRLGTHFDRRTPRCLMILNTIQV